MLRKTVLAVAAIAALGAAALAPTSASAHPWKFHPHVGWGFYGGPGYVPVGPIYKCFWVEKVTPFGVKLVKVCKYY